MYTTLLATKFYIPPLCPTYMPRPRLITALSQALTRRLTLVSAPAGYGKTTLVSSWLRETDVTSTWLSLDESDNDPTRFLSYLFAALQTAIPSIRAVLPSILTAVQPALFDAHLKLLIKEITDHTGPLVLVLDDFQVIHSQPVLEALTFLIEYMPPQMHLLLLTRTDPFGLPLSRLRLRNQLLDIRADHLRFTPREVAVFLNDVMGLHLSADDTSAMDMRTEGWVAGLQLAALSMQDCPDTHRFVSAFTGSHYYIMDYLADEVLKLQPEEVRTFLLQTSILERMCGPLCRAVVETDMAGPPDGQAMLEALKRANLFLIPLDDERRWYRYHHLFADVLNRRLEHLFPQLLPALHQRASLWYEQNGCLTEAIQHALQAGDKPRMIQMVEQNGCSLLMRGEVTTLARWLAALESEIPLNPWLSILEAWTLTLSGRLERVEHILQSAEQQLKPLERTIETQIMLGTAAAARAHYANVQGKTRLATDSARQALELLPDNNSFSCDIRSVATAILGDACWIGGNFDEARQTYAQAVSISVTAGDIYSAIIAYVDLADVQMEQGQLHQATWTYAEIMRMAARPDRQELPLVHRAYAGMGRVFYEWNQLDAAEQHFQNCVRLGQQWSDPESQLAGCIMLAWLEFARGHPDYAQAVIRSAEELAVGARLVFKQSYWVKYALARLWLTQGEVAKARQLVPQGSLSSDGEIPYPQEPAFLLKLRMLLTEGDCTAALTLSERLLRQAERTNRLARVIELLNLQSLAYWGRHETSQAMTTLERAVALAQPEGYIRVFLDEGEALAKLLYRVRVSHVEAGYVAKLLAAITSSPSGPQPVARSLIEPLSARELEVLRLMAAGYSNQEIAVKLVISEKTVKRHISNIYDKLAARSRTQALSLAREVGLLR
jgi:LuxR family transcriptional regulator, maltose regulon positive regulatory protein